LQLIFPTFLHHQKLLRAMSTQLVEHDAQISGHLGCDEVDETLVFASDQYGHSGDDHAESGDSVPPGQPHPTEAGAAADSVSARSPLGQQFRRAIAHQPDISSIYSGLDEALRQQFRQAWAEKKDWDFVQEQREIRRSFSRAFVTSGTPVNFTQLCNLLGGHEVEVACQEAQIYKDRCIALGPPFVSRNSMTGAAAYIYVYNYIYRVVLLPPTTDTHIQHLRQQQQQQTRYNNKTSNNSNNNNNINNDNATETVGSHQCSSVLCWHFQAINNSRTAEKVTRRPAATTTNNSWQ